jgi:hypothetical protein
VFIVSNSWTHNMDTRCMNNLNKKCTWTRFMVIRSEARRIIQNFNSWIQNIMRKNICSCRNSHTKLWKTKKKICTTFKSTYPIMKNITKRSGACQRAHFSHSICFICAIYLRISRVLLYPYRSCYLNSLIFNQAHFKHRVAF